MESNGKRDLILKAAAQAFGTKGFHETKVEEIAEMAGVAKGTVYLYFKDKNNLLYEVARFIATQYMAKVTEAVAEKTSAVDQLKAYAYFHISQMPYVMKYNKLFVVHIQQAAKIPESEFMEMLRQQHSELMSFIGGIIEKGTASGELRDIAPREAAFLFLGSLQSYMHAAMVGMINDEPPLELADKMVNLLLKGIGARQDNES